MSSALGAAEARQKSASLDTGAQGEGEDASRPDPRSGDAPEDDEAALRSEEILGADGDGSPGKPKATNFSVFEAYARVEASAAAGSSLSKQQQSGSSEGSSSGDAGSRSGLSTRRSASARDKAAVPAQEPEGPSLCLYTSTIPGPPPERPLLLSPLSSLPDRTAAASFCPRAACWHDFALPPKIQNWEDKRLRRYRLEADIVQLKTSLKFIKEVVKDGNRQLLEAQMSRTKQAKALKALESELSDLAGRAKQPASQEALPSTPHGADGVDAAASEAAGGAPPNGEKPPEPGPEPEQASAATGGTAAPPKRSGKKTKGSGSKGKR